MNYERINFKNGQLVSPGSVDLETGELTMPVYTGETPINDVNLNKMDEAIEYLFENGVGGGSLPSGAIVDYEGTEVPVGYEEVTETTYSTDETDTGMTWIDGKPIYRKVIKILNIPAFDTKNEQVVSLSNVDTMVNMNGIVQGGASLRNYYSNLGVKDLSGICYESSFYFNKSNSQIIVVFPTGNADGTNVTLIAEYTKTID